MTFPRIGPKVPVHLVVRYSDRLLGNIDTVARHKEVLNKQGCVWVGKIGRALNTSEFERQLEAGISTFVYLVKPTLDGFSFMRAQLLSVQREMPSKKTAAIPPYYYKHDLPSRIGMWMLVKNLKAVDDEERRELVTRSSARPVTQTLSESSAGAFVVQRVQPEHQVAWRDGYKQRRPSISWEFSEALLDADEEFEPRSIYDDV